MLQNFSFSFRSLVKVQSTPHKGFFKIFRIRLSECRDFSKRFRTNLTSYSRADVPFVHSYAKPYKMRGVTWSNSHYETALSRVLSPSPVGFAYNGNVRTIPGSWYAS